MAPLTFEGKPLRRHHERIPLFVDAVDRLVSSHADMLSLPSVRRLLHLMFLRLRDDLELPHADVDLLAPHDRAAVRASIVYLSNISTLAVIRTAFAAARHDVMAMAACAHPRRLRLRTSLDLAVASIMAGVRAARAARRTDDISHDRQAER